MLGFFAALCMLITSPLSTIAGMIAESNRALPFVLNLGLTIAAIVLACMLWKIGLPEDESPEAVAKEAASEPYTVETPAS